MAVLNIDAPNTVFLDLQRLGSNERQRVVIELFPGTSMGQHFLVLCTGEDGPSYRNTRLAILKHGRDGEKVCGGDYDGMGGRALAGHRLGTKNNERPEDEGDVCGRRIGRDWSAQFAVITRRPPYVPDNKTVFGRVVEGLDVLQEAADTHTEDHPITDIEVVDCGVVQ